MKRLWVFYLYLLHRFHVWAIKGQQGWHKAGAYTTLGIVLFANIVTVVEVIGLVKGRRISVGFMPDFQHDAKVVMLIWILCYFAVIVFVMSKVKLLDTAESQPFFKLYESYGFKGWHALSYTIFSFCILFFMAYLKGTGVY